VEYENDGTVVPFCYPAVSTQWPTTADEHRRHLKRYRLRIDSVARTTGKTTELFRSNIDRRTYENGCRNVRRFNSQNTARSAGGSSFCARFPDRSLKAYPRISRSAGEHDARIIIAKTSRSFSHPFLSTRVVDVRPVRVSSSTRVPDVRAPRPGCIRAR